MPQEPKEEKMLPAKDMRVYSLDMPSSIVCVHACFCEDGEGVPGQPRGAGEVDQARKDEAPIMCSTGGFTVSCFKVDKPAAGRSTHPFAQEADHTQEDPAQQVSQEGWQFTFMSHLISHAHDHDMQVEEMSQSGDGSKNLESKVRPPTACA